MRHYLDFEKPVSRGFGTRSVIASVESQLGGKAEFDWRSEGLICRLRVPLNGHLAPTASEPQHAAMLEKMTPSRASRSADA